MKKKYMKIPKVVFISCSNCGKRCKRRVPEDFSPGFFDCDNCSNRMNTPVSSCCIICAYTGKKCAPTLIMEAKIKGLEIR
ncbi:hypothetical protein FJZ18_00490 [Candidatus Pacearchaeota archaeon]|nr:hypothetical protein [Candidatus Pacearchaeota archaeon]